MIPDDARPISLGKGLFTFVSGSDFNACNELTWRAQPSHGTHYAITNVYAERNGKRIRTTISLHRFICNPPAHLEVHHKDANGLHNWRSNLLVCSHKYNVGEIGPGVSGFYGVSRHGKKWRAQITAQGATRQYSKHLGTYSTAIEAAQAYDYEALRLHGPNARLNFPVEIDQDEWTRQTERLQAEKAALSVPPF